MRIVKDPLERKQEILEEAVRIFAKKGYEKTSMSDIARELHISQGLCYRYFPSKEVIYEEALELYAERAAKKHIKSWNEEEKTFQELVFSYSGDLLEYQNAESKIQSLSASFSETESRKMQEQLMIAVGKKLIPHMAKLLERAERLGEISVTDPYITAYMLVFGQIGVMMDRQIPVQEKQERIQKTILELVKVRKT